MKRWAITKGKMGRRGMMGNKEMIMTGTEWRLCFTILSPLTILDEVKLLPSSLLSRVEHSKIIKQLQTNPTNNTGTFNRTFPFSIEELRENFHSPTCQVWHKPLGLMPNPAWDKRLACILRYQCEPTVRLPTEEEATVWHCGGEHLNGNSLLKISQV